MSAAHMGMVFAAEGIDGSEKLLLLGYTNYTDPHGYCWPSEARMVDDCGTSRSTVQRAKRKLTKLNLLKSVRRINPKTGEPISNLSRVNLPLLASMARQKVQYDDNLINAITFEDDSQGDPTSTLAGTSDDPEPTSDLLKGHSDSHPESNRLTPRVNMTPTPSQNDAQSLTDPLSDPSVEPDAPSARSAGDARRASDRSSARASRGGSAAATTDQAASGNSRGWATVSPEVHAVLSALPEELMSEVLRVAKTRRPKGLVPTIQEQLSARTVPQMLARIERRWYGHGHRDAGLPGGVGWKNPAGVANALVRAEKCPLPRCEDGADLDDGRACRACEERDLNRQDAAKAKRKAKADDERAAKEAFAAMLQQPDEGFAVAYEYLSEPTSKRRDVGGDQGKRPPKKAEFHASRRPTVVDVPPVPEQRDVVAEEPRGPLRATCSVCSAWRIQVAVWEGHPVCASCIQTCTACQTMQPEFNYGPDSGECRACRQLAPAPA